MCSSLATADLSRMAISKKTDVAHKATYGQYMTPANVAKFMASLFAIEEFSKDFRILDAGSGVGSLSCALLDQIKNTKKSLSQKIDVSAVELDENVIDALHQNLGFYKDINAHICHQDFIDYALQNILERRSSFTHIILNPPYKKIGAKSKERLILKQLNIDVVNLYAAFVALSIELLSDEGQLVAIIPRSFCNGTYYRPFREFLLKKVQIQRIHLFSSRNKLFGEEGVLQENIILHLKRTPARGKITISNSTDADLNDTQQKDYAYEEIVLESDPQKFIHIPTLSSPTIELPVALSHTLTSIGIQVSTGPVVDFRVKEALLSHPVIDSVPLLYPIHFKDNKPVWPNHKSTKPNALLITETTKKSLYKNGFYCVVRRFSSKEEDRRIVPGFIAPEDFSGYEYLGFENHLNVFHFKKQGLSEQLALGLTIYLRSKFVDDYFRRFSGHTQVNVGDLKQLPYPNIQTLHGLADWAKAQSYITQELIDQKIEELL